MSKFQFTQLNIGWNAQPNVPEPVVSEQRPDLILKFLVNFLQFPLFKEGERGLLRFRNASRYRLGGTNDEGWYRGQCRYSKLAPAWGEFYELAGDDPQPDVLDDWRVIEEWGGTRHFLFYFRDSTFEVFADDWLLEPTQENALLRVAQ